MANAYVIKDTYGTEEIIIANCIKEAVEAWCANLQFTGLNDRRFESKILSVTKDSRRVHVNKDLKL